MRTILEWLKPGARVKRYILLQIVSVAVLIFCIVTLKNVYDLNQKMLLAYIVLITLSVFGMIFSFILAQKNILFISLKNIARKNKSIRVRKLLYNDPKLKKGPKIVVIGGGSGLPNILKGLKEYTANITAVVNVSEDDATLSSTVKGGDYLSSGDIRKCIAALSTSESEINKLLTYKSDDENLSVGNEIIKGLVKTNGSFAKGIAKISDLFKMQGNIYPVTTDNIVLCAGLKNGEVVVGKENIVERVKELKTPIKQIFLKEGTIRAYPEVIDAIKNANVIILGPGNLYTSVASNLLIEDVSKAIIHSKAKKVYIANIMNQPGQTDGYTLAKYINEIERYIGKHVLDYAIVNNGKITDEMIKDFNQKDSTPVRIDLENIQNRAISVVKDDIVLTATDSLIHDSDRVADIIMSIAKSKKNGKLNIVKVNKKQMKKKKIGEFKKNLKTKMNNNSKKSEELKSKNKIKRPKKQTEVKMKKSTKKTVDKIKSKVMKG